MPKKIVFGLIFVMLYKKTSPGLVPILKLCKQNTEPNPYILSFLPTRFNMSSKFSLKSFNTANICLVNIVFIIWRQGREVREGKGREVREGEGREGKRRDGKRYKGKGRKGKGKQGGGKKTEGE